MTRPFLALSVAMLLTACNIDYPQPAADTKPAALNSAPATAKSPVSSGRATIYQQGEDFYNRREFGEALGLWRPLADQGDPKAQVKLGDMYARAQGVAQDQALAVAWYRKAAHQGNEEARANLGSTVQSSQKTEPYVSPLSIAEGHYLAAVASHADRAIVCGTLNDAIDASLVAQDQHAWSVLKAQKAQQYCN